MNPRTQKRKKYLDPATVNLIKQIVWGLLVFFVVGLFLSIIWFGSRIDALTISTIETEGGITINEQEVKARAEAGLEGTYLRLIPKRFAYVYPKDDILARVLEVARIKDVVVERVSGTTIRITYDEYIPDTLWCGFSDEDRCLFLDEKGFAFATAPVLQGESVVRYFATERELEKGAVPFLDVDYQTSKTFTESLSSIGWFVKKIEINSARDVFYTLAGGGEIKATLADEALRPFDNLQTILNSEEFSHLKPGNFQYLDLRFGTRVFVNEVLLTDDVATSTATTTEDALDILIDEVLE
jgi:hypothetical protein